MPEIVAINLHNRIALLDDATTAPITNMLDAYGEETDDPDEAVGWVACVLGRWHAGAVSDFEFVKPN